MSRLQVSDLPSLDTETLAESAKTVNPPIWQQSQSQFAPRQARVSISASSVDESHYSESIPSPGSSVFSPAAEFLGSFSTSSRARASSSVSRDGMSDGKGNESSSYQRSFIQPDPDEEGEEVDGYVIGKVLGQGSFSTVKEARHIETGEVVAVKIVRHGQPSLPEEGLNQSWAGLARSTSQSRSSTPINDGKGQAPARLKAETRRFNRARSCSSPAIPLTPRFAIDGLPPTSEEDSDPASPMSIDGSSESSSDSRTGAGDVSKADAALQKEVYIWSQLDEHPSIVPLHHYYESDFASFIFMPRCTGNLLQHVKEYGRGGSKSPELRASSPPSRAGSISGGSVSRSPKPAFAGGLGMASPAGQAQNKPQRSGSIRMRRPGELPSGGAGLPLPQVQRIFAQIVAGLLYLHQHAKITHKDIKLENILQDVDGNFRISDFGLAHGPAQMAAFARTADSITSPMSSPGADGGARTPLWSRMDGKARREHALSDSDIITSISPRLPGKNVPFPSLGEAASLILPSGTTPPIEENVTVNLGASLPKSSGLSASRPGFGQRRSHLYSIPSSVAPSALLNGAAAAGSLQYTSPEQIKSPGPVTDASVDIWALGCVLYAMLEGRLPFDDGFEPRLRVNIIKGEWDLPTALKRHATNSPNPNDAEQVSDEDKEQVEALLRGCLEKEVSKRWSIEQIASCSWLAPALEQLDLGHFSPTSGRGRKRDYIDSDSGENADRVASRMTSRSRSRGRPTTARPELSTVAAQGRPASMRRGPSMDDYRRAREGGTSRSRNSHSRSASRPRRLNNGDSSGWEIV